MEFGFSVPNRGPQATPEAVARLVRRGEELEFGIVCVSDHIVIPRTIQSQYPYAESGRYHSESGRYPGSGECMEQLTLLGFLAAHTSTVRLLTSVMVLPYRSPVLAAKMLATIDVLSNGRLIVGCGVGWMREEFEVLGAPSYDERGAVGSEYIRVFKELWTSDNPAFDGKYSRFSDVAFEPRPVQKPHPPIWIGGESSLALRRAVQLGDGWYPIGSNPAYPLGTPALLALHLARLSRYAEEAGRDPASVDIAYNAPWYDDRKAGTMAGGQRRVLTGTPEQIAGDIRDFSQLGVRHLLLGLQGGTLEETLERMERFAADVAPLAKF